MDALVCMWKPEDNSWESPLFFHAEPGLAGSKAFTRWAVSPAQTFVFSINYIVLDCRYFYMYKWVLQRTFRRKLRPLNLAMFYGSRQVLLEAGHLTESLCSLHILCDLGVWPDLSALVSLSKAWAAVRINWVETHERLQKVPHTVNSQKTIDSLTMWMLCYGWVN